MGSRQPASGRLEPAAALAWLTGSSQHRPGVAKAENRLTASVQLLQPGPRVPPYPQLLQGFPSLSNPTPSDFAGKHNAWYMPSTVLSAFKSTKLFNPHKCYSCFVEKETGTERLSNLPNGTQ